MSFQAVNWAIEQRAGGPSGKTVLWSIANYANEDWCAWPSQRRIAEESEQSTDSVQRRISELVELGLVRRLPLKFAGRKTVDFFILQPSPYFRASLVQIESLLPRGCVVDPAFIGPNAAADCGSTPETKQEQDDSAPGGSPKPALPQTLPQSAADAAALVRQQEPVMEPEKGERSRTDERFEQLARLWPNKTRLADAALAFAELDERAQTAAVAFAPSFLGAEKKAGRTKTESLLSYLRGRPWRFADQAAARQTAPDPRIEVKAFSKPAWAMLFRGINALAGGGEPEGIEAALRLVRQGGRISPSLVPRDDELAGLVAIETGSVAYEEWATFAARLGFVLPKPDQSPMVFLPGITPTALSLDFDGYVLARPADLHIRGIAWWWRLHRPGAPIVELIAAGRRINGNDRVTTGPLPLAAELNGMLEIEQSTAMWPRWAGWFARRGAPLMPWPDRAIWCPSPFPPDEEESRPESAEAMGGW